MDRGKRVLWAAIVFVVVVAGVLAVRAYELDSPQRGLPQRVADLETALGMADGSSSVITDLRTAVNPATLTVGWDESSCEWWPESQGVWITPKLNQSAGINFCPGNKVMTAFQSGSHGTDQEVRYKCCTLKIVRVP